MDGQTDGPMDLIKLEEFVKQEEKEESEREVALIHAANILGRTYDEIVAVHQKLGSEKDTDRFLNVIYWLGNLAVEEETTGNKLTITLVLC